MVLKHCEAADWKLVMEKVLVTIGERLLGIRYLVKLEEALMLERGRFSNF